MVNTTDPTANDNMILDIVRNAIKTRCENYDKNGTSGKYNDSEKFEIMAFLMKRIDHEMTNSSRQVAMFLEVLQQHAQICACIYPTVDKWKQEHDLVKDEESRVILDLNFLNTFLDDMVEPTATEQLSADNEKQKKSIDHEVCKALMTYCEAFRKSTDPPVNYDDIAMKMIDDFIARRGQLHESNEDYWLSKLFEHFFYHSGSCNCSYKAMGNLMEFHVFANNDAERLKMDEGFFEGLMGNINTQLRAATLKPTDTINSNDSQMFSFKEASEKAALAKLVNKINEAITHYCSEQDLENDPEFSETVDQFKCENFFIGRSIYHDVEFNDDLSMFFDAFANHANICICPAKVMKDLTALYKRARNDEQKSRFDNVYYYSVMKSAENTQKLNRILQSPVKTSSGEMRKTGKRSLSPQSLEHNFNERVKFYCKGVEKKQLTKLYNGIDKNEVDWFFLNRTQICNDNEMIAFFNALQKHFETCRCIYVPVCKLISQHKGCTDEDFKLETDKSFYELFIKNTNNYERDTPSPAKKSKQEKNVSFHEDIIMHFNEKPGRKNAKLVVALEKYIDTQEELREKGQGSLDEKSVGPIQKFLIEKHIENIRCPRKWSFDNTFDFFTQRMMHHKNAANQLLEKSWEERNNMELYESSHIAKCFEFLAFQELDVLDTDAYCLKMLLEEIPRIEFRYLEMVLGKKKELPIVPFI